MPTESVVESILAPKPRSRLVDAAVRRISEIVERTFGHRGRHLVGERANDRLSRDRRDIKESRLSLTLCRYQVSSFRGRDHRRQSKQASNECVQGGSLRRVVGCPRSGMARGFIGAWIRQSPSLWRCGPKVCSHSTRIDLCDEGKRERCEYMGEVIFFKSVRSLRYAI